MGKIIGLMSYKGGVGVSTLLSLLANALAEISDKPVMVADCKYGGDLDILMSMSDESLRTFDDLSEDMPLSDILTKRDNIEFCRSPIIKGADHSGAYKSILSAREDHEYILLDSPEDASVCDLLLVVTTPCESSVRCAAMAVCDSENVDTALIINRFGEEDNAILPDDIIDICYARLMGIVPYAQFFTDLSKARDIKAACSNIAKRISGEDINIFEGLKSRQSLKRLMTE